MTIPKGVVCTVQPKAWMDEKLMFEWITKVWIPYVGKNRALLCLDTFSAHLTEAVREEFARIGSKLLIIPGGCTSVLQPLDVSLNKPFKSYIRRQWYERMVSEAEIGAAKITPASKSTLMELIANATDIVESNSQGVVKSFQVTGILKKPDCTRSDALQGDIELLMKDVFGPDHMGYVEPTDDPFADSESSSEELEGDQLQDIVSDYSELDYSDISDMNSNDECIAKSQANN